MRRKWRVFVFCSMTGVVLVSCGTARTTIDGSAASRAPVNASASADLPSRLGDALVIPPPESASDARTPLERFLGVPADPIAATRWDHDQIQAGIKDCLNRIGYEYKEEAFAVEGTESDPNLGYMESLTPDQMSEYTRLRWANGDGSGKSCEEQASDRVHVMNTMSEEYAPYNDEFYARPEVAVAADAISACVNQGGQAAECQDKNKWSEVSRRALDDVELKFIARYRTELEGFIANRPLEGGK
jgi:hypothetical protein